MVRACQPELLDSLAPDDPGAVGSRRDLRRLNFWMGNARLIANALKSFLPEQPEQKILEIGAGDGTLLLEIARRLSPKSSRWSAMLLDRQEIITSATRTQFQALGWGAKTVKADVFEYFQSGSSSSAGSYDAIIANLFLHHFSAEALAELFRLAQTRTRLFIAIEPRRSRLSLLAGRLIWAIGCNSVTRHDAVVSIRAGFCGQEFSSLWPQTAGWTREEHPAGLFSHVFIARWEHQALLASEEATSRAEAMDFSI